MRDYNYIPLPSKEEKEQSIQFIVASGMPARQSLSAALPIVFKSVGFRGLFFGIGECVFLAVLASVLLWVCLLSAIDSNNILLYALFSASPFLYAALHLLITWKEIMSGTYEFMMTCRCSLRQLTVLRMLVFGGVCVVVSVIVSTITGIISAGGISIFRCVSVSFSALFLFAAVQLLVDWKWHSPKCHFAAPIFWLLLSFVLFLLGEKSMDFIINIPNFVFWIITMISLSVYVVTVKRYYFNPKEGALKYAVS